MILITMAGLSSRFKKEGYSLPKYMLPLKEKTVFDFAVLSFKKYFQTENFIFVIRNDYQIYDFVKNSLKKLNVKNFQIIALSETQGQADTAYQALNKTKIYDHNEDLVIFNIDTFRPDFSFPDIINNCDGYLEVFKGEGENWSFILPDEKIVSNVKQTTEKRKISEFCSTGLYYFKNINLFKTAYEDSLNYDISFLEANERYIAPLYNFLISNKYVIKFNLITSDDVIFCGVPNEYESLLNE